MNPPREVTAGRADGTLGPGEVPLVALDRSYLAARAETEAAVLRVLRSGKYVQGAEVGAFETEFASFCHARHAIAVHSGTAALHLALVALEIGRDDEVVTVPNTFFATVEAIIYTGARPVLVDVDRLTANMDPTGFARGLTRRTRAVIPVHLYGRPAEMNPILDACRRTGVDVVEDACQAHGARYRGRPVGTLGRLGCFSFYPTKNLGACGEGGAVVTDDPDLAATMRVLRDHGQRTKGHHERLGFNYRMDEITAAILRVRLTCLGAAIDARREIARRYCDGLRGLPIEILTPVDAEGHAFYVFVVRTPERERLRRYLASRGIQTAVHYPEPIHVQPPLRALGYRPGAFPISEALAGEILSLPMDASLRPDEIERVVLATREFFA